MSKASSLKPQAPSSRGFTLMELLVVLLIIGILSTVAIRTIDATRDRALFDQTTEEIKQLVYAVTGNPDVMAGGGRVDFGFFGDMGRLPDDLRELVEKTGDSLWRGPYFRRGLAGDSVGFLYDAWGNPYTYDRSTGTIATIGNGKFPMTMKVVDDLAQLYDNSIVGQVTDAESNPPGEAGVRIYLCTNCGLGSGYTTASRGGDYAFGSVPAGIHRLVALYETSDSIVRWVTVVPRSRSVVDFRFGRVFQSRLLMVGQPEIPPGVPDSSGFVFDVVSTYATSITIDSIVVEHVSDSVYFRTLQIDYETQPGYPRLPGQLIGPGQATAPIVPAVKIAGQMAQRMTFGLLEFATNSAGSDTAKIAGKTFRLRFSDGSVITVKP